MIVICTSIHGLQDLAFSVWERQRRQSSERTMKSSLASGDLGYPGQQGSREDWLRGFSWELEMREQKDKMLLIKGKYFHKKALQEKKPSQDGELQLEGVRELQESPGSCLTLVPASSCTSPRWSWPCSRVVRMLPAAAGRSAQGSCSTPMHWDRDPPGTHSPRHWWVQQGRVDPHCPDVGLAAGSPSPRASVSPSPW